MSLGKIIRVMLAASCGLLLCGCDSPGPGVADEEKEPQFLIGRSKVNSMDFHGAVGAFEEALEKNPQSAAAHFELGWLYAEKEADPAAAIYHYEKFLKLKPSADNADTIRQHIFRLKQELAKVVFVSSPSAEIQRQVEQLAEDNRRLLEELARARGSVSQAQPVAATNRIAAQSTNVRSNSVQTSRAAVSNQNTSGAGRGTTVASVSARSYRVQAGDTPSSIARRYNVKLETLLSANPALNPRRMQVGQSLAIPVR